MCNLNVLVGAIGKEYVPLLINASSASYASNDDSEGAFFSASGKIVKKEGKIPLWEYMAEIGESDVALTHQRISTSGHTFDNCQPFTDERFVVIHNGIFGITPVGTKSDTAMFFDAFTKAVKDGKEIRVAIEGAVKECEYGSYSVFIYDMQEKIGYYFKSYSTSITIRRLKKGYFITTSESNCSFVEDGADTNMRVDEDHLYRFQKNKKGKMVMYDDGPMDIKSGYGYGSRCTYMNGGWDSGYGMASSKRANNFLKEEEVNKVVDELKDDYYLGCS